VLISDLHAGGPHVDAARVAKVVAFAQRRRPDLAVLLGDYVDPEVTLGSEVAPEAVAEALSGFRGRFGTVAVLGNHDWSTDGPRVWQALQQQGIRVLENDAVRVRPNPGELWVAGVADTRDRRPDIERALAKVPAHAAVLLLSHDPDLFPRVPPRVALTLSGHTHGGQVAIPLLRRLWIPSRFGERYAGGHVVEGGRHLFITRGVGSSGQPVRLGAPPEVVVLRLRPSSGRASRAG
jgi:predicted MPP superfamily phosphohydrolase